MCNPFKTIPLLTMLAAVAMLAFAAACGDDDSDPPASPSATAAPTLAPGVTPGPGVTNDEIFLGMTNDLSGEGNTPYAAVTSAILAYFAALNEEQGGVCGRDIILLTGDDQYTPEIALEETKRLVEEEEVLAIIGAQSTEAHLLVAPYLHDPDGNRNTADSVPDLFVSSGWSGWGDVDEFPWTIGFIPDYASDGQVIATYINEEHADEKVGLLYEDSGFGADYLAGISGTIDDDGRLVAIPYTPPPPAATATPASAPDASPTPTAAAEDTETPDASQAPEFDAAALVDQLVEAGAEVVVLATEPDVTAEIYLAAEEKDFHPVFIISYVNTASSLAAAVGGGTSADHLLAGFEMLDGTITTQYLLNLVENEGDPNLVEHQRIMETYDGPAVTTLSVYGQTLAETVVETLERACTNLNREGVLSAAESISGFSPSLLLPGMSVRLGPDDHRAIETLQPVRIEADGVLTPMGDPISAEG